MSAVEETKIEISVPQARAVPASPSIVTRFLNLLSSVRFGVSLLILMVVACMIGMLIMQQNVEGFDKYYAALTPSQRLLYGSLDFFDIYHAWYFNALLLLLSLNIVLASIDRFPKAWTFISRKKLDASPTWLKGQERHATLAIKDQSQGATIERVVAALRGGGFKSIVTEKNGRTFVFGERGAWNRLGAYAVHVALLTIFFGGFMTSQFGRTGNLRLTPGAASSEMTELEFQLDQLTPRAMALPFEVVCLDIQQKLIEKDGPITANNTLDWLTRVKIKDAEFGDTEALVHMNRPFDYRGYRFFQASFDPTGKARHIKLRVTPEQGGAAQEVSLPRDGATTLPDGTKIEFADFFADVSTAAAGPQAQPRETTSYPNPAALLQVTPATGGAPVRAFALAAELPANAPVAAAKAGYKYRLVDFEKVPNAHVLSIQYDPGATVVYVGFLLLGLTLSAVFFFSHQRVWALIEERGGAQQNFGAESFEVTLGGNTNRNKLGFEDRFKRLVANISGHPLTAESRDEGA